MSSSFVPGSLYANYKSFDFTGKVPSDISARNAWIQSQAPMTSTAGDLVVTTNQGSPIQTNILNLLGRAGIITNTIAADTVEIGDNRNLTPYVVGMTTSVTSDNPAEYTSIQAAINQAVADGATPSNRALILIKPGQYAENLTVPESVILEGSSFNASVLVGQLTLSGLTSVNSVTEIRSLGLVQPIGSPIINAPNASAGRCDLFECFLFQTDPTNPIILFNIPLATDSSQITITSCALVGSGPGFDLCQSSGLGKFQFQLVYGGLINGRVNLTNTNVNGSVFSQPNDYRFLTSFLTDVSIVVTAGNSQTVFESTNIDNSGSGAVAFNCLGYCVFLGGRVSNAPMTIPATAVGIIRGSVLYSSLVTCDGDIYAGGNFIRHAFADRLVGTGNYYKENGLLGGSNVFEAGSSNTTTITNVLAANMG